LFVFSWWEERAVFCLAAQVESAFEIEEGQFIAEILLQLTPERTIQTTSLERAQNWVVEDLPIEVGVLTRCPSALEQRLESRLRAGWVTRTAVPHPLQPRRKLSEPFSDGATKALFAEVLREGPLDSLEKYSQHKALSPIGSELSRRIELADQSRKVELATLIAFHDPLANQNSSSPTSALSRAVDVALVPLNPDSVVARRFLQTDGEVDLPAQLEKIERGEIVHQRTVRRLARGFSAIGLTPLASTSIDLAFALPGGLVLMEVKSVHPQNIVSQLLSAVGQLLFYESEFADAEGSRTICGHIILASEHPLQIPETCYRLASRAGVGLEHIVVAMSEESPLLDLAERLRGRGHWAR
jgi:hypothetical protein